MYIHTMYIAEGIIHTMHIAEGIIQYFYQQQNSADSSVKVHSHVVGILWYTLMSYSTPFSDMRPLGTSGSLGKDTCYIVLSVFIAWNS